MVPGRQDRFGQGTHRLREKAAGVAQDQAAKAYKRTQEYLAEKDLLKTFHDAGEHSEAAVLDVLHKTAVGHGKNGPGPNGATPTAPVRKVAARWHPPAARTGRVAAARRRNPPRHPFQLSTPARCAGRSTPASSAPSTARVGARCTRGIDIAAHPGEPVYAIAGGDVIYAGDGLRGYGNVVIIRHDKQMTSLYAHNSELKVHQGDHVAQGTLVALLGSTGHSTGPHVHFEVREGDAAVDPKTLLPKSTYAAVLVDDPDEEQLAELIIPLTVRRTHCNAV